VAVLNIVVVVVCRSVGGRGVTEFSGQFSGSWMRVWSRKYISLYDADRGEGQIVAFVTEFIGGLL
jgi:hypothetical protein